MECYHGATKREIELCNLDRRNLKIKQRCPQTKAESITCPRCEKTSYNPNDIKYGYCGFCHNFTTTTVHTTIGQAIRASKGSSGTTL